MDASTTSKILEHLCQTIGGDWLLVGGALVQMELNSDRATEDIDLALMKHATKSSETAQDELFRYSMQNLNVGPESINLAVTPFLNDIPDWRSEVKVLKTGKQGVIYRPSLTLFIALKLKRASTIDLRDIRSALEKLPGDELDEEKLKSWSSPKAFQRYLELKKT